MHCGSSLVDISRVCYREYDFIGSTIWGYDFYRVDHRGNDFCSSALPRCFDELML